MDTSAEEKTDKEHSIYKNLVVGQQENNDEHKPFYTKEECPANFTNPKTKEEHKSPLACVSNHLFLSSFLVDSNISVNTFIQSIIRNHGNFCANATRIHVQMNASHRFAM